MYLFQKGTPFLYQGQEIGMTNWRPESADMYRDVQTIYNYNHSNLKLSEDKRLQKMWRSSRDSARTPVQWSSDANAGFTTAPVTWIGVNPNYTSINVADQEQDPNSVLNFYRKAVALRKSLSCVRHGQYKEYFPHSSKLYVYTMEDDKQTLLVVCSFSKKEEKLRTPSSFPLEKAKLRLSNYNDLSSKLKPYECRLYLLQKEVTP